MFCWSTRLRISCGHRYAHPDWSATENTAVYGSDYSPEGLGHNLELLLFAEISPAGRPLFLESAQAVAQNLDHSVLHEEIRFFHTQVPTAENIARYVAQELRNRSPQIPLRQIRVHESPRFFVDHHPAQGELFFSHFATPMAWLFQDREIHHYSAVCTFAGAWNPASGLSLNRQLVRQFLDARTPFATDSPLPHPSAPQVPQVPIAAMAKAFRRAWCAQVEDDRLQFIALSLTTSGTKWTAEFPLELPWKFDQNGAEPKGGSPE